MSEELIQYQNANESYEKVKENFIIRKNEFKRVIDDIQNTEEGSSYQHYIFVGRRGSGKSTLLRRIQAEIETVELLKKRFLVVNLGEEQSGIYKLYDLWDYVIRDLNAQGNKIETPDFRNYKDDLKSFTKVLHGNIVASLRSKNKKLVLLIDNIDRILDSLGEDTALLRELLMNYKEIRIIGSSTVMSEHFWKYDMPFYQFFSIKRLEALSLKEVEQLLIHWSEIKKVDEIKDFLKKYPGKIQSIRMLTDGLPRTMLLFVDMLLNRKEQNGYDYLQRIVDKATPVFQERLLAISPAQRKVLTELAYFWDAATVEQLILKCNMDGKTISALLAQLSNLRYVEKIKGSTKNLYYRLEERFFNLWLNMTQGGPQQRHDAKALTEFLETWYDKEELQSLTLEFTKSIRNQHLKSDYIDSMSQALLKCEKLDLEIKQDLILGMFKSGFNVEDFKIENVFDDFNKAIGDAFESNDFQKAIEILEISNLDMGRKYFGKGLAYQNLGDYDSAIDNYEKSITLKHWEGYINLGYIYSKKEDFDKSEKYYLLALENGILGSLDSLAKIYLIKEDYQKAEYYYKEAINHGSVRSIINLAIFYKSKGQLNLAEELYLKAIDNWRKVINKPQNNNFENEKKLKKSNLYNGYLKALNNLGNIYSDLKKYDLAKELYLEAISLGEVSTLNNLAVLFEENNEFEKAEEYFIQATLNNNLDAFKNLALLYSKLNRTEEAEKYFLLAIDRGEVELYNNLGVLYDNNNDFTKAEEYYLNAINNGNVHARSNLALCYYQYKKREKLKIYIDTKKDIFNEMQIETKILLSLYVGEFKLFRDLFLELLDTSKGGVISSDLVIDILIHYQYQLINNYFLLNEEAKESYKPLYFVTLALLNEKDTLRMPPEIEENVNDILKYIKENQEFYYGSK